MHIKLKNFWYRVNSNFLFLPATLTTAAILVSFLTTAVDRIIADHEAARQWWTYSGGADGARTILSVISGSMITVAGVVFSVTIVVLSLASSQFGPRLIRNFMNVKANQLVLGTFVATFTYGVLVLRTVDASADTRYVPGLSVNIAIGTALVSLGVLIYFIHSVSESIQAQNIIDRVHRDLDSAVSRIFPEKLGDARQHSNDIGPREYDISNECNRESCPILAECSGYFQAIDNDGLMDIAVEENLLLYLGHRPGNFITKGDVLVTVWPGSKVNSTLSDAINGVFILGRERTSEQDVEYAISKLAEIAARSLSSGINDPITAITCIDWLGASLCRLARRKMPSSHRYDNENRLRIICKPFTFGGMVDAAFNIIRQSSESIPAVSIRMLETIATIAAQTRKKDDQAVLLRQAVIITNGCKRKFTSDDDRNDLEERFKVVVKLTKGVL